MTIKKVDLCISNSKPDHPPGQIPGEFFEKANSSPHPPGTRKVRKPRPQGQKNHAKTPPPGQLFPKGQQKTLQNMRQKS